MTISNSTFQNMQGIAAPAVSGAGDGRIYFDSTSNTFKASQNGAAYVDMIGGGGGGGGQDYILLQDQKASGTDGGTFTSGAWQTRVLNTEVTDTGGHCSLAANQFTLSAGTYRIRAKAPAYSVFRHMARLQNITDGTTTSWGTSEFNYTTNQHTTSSWVEARFTIASSKVFELQHRCQSTQATNGFGQEVGTQFTVDHETYTTVELFRDKDASAGFILLQEQQTSGTDAGTFTSGAWQTRPINTEVFDTGGHCSLAANQFTLVAGTYRVYASATARGVDAHKIRLQNITDATTEVLGESAYVSAADASDTDSYLIGRFTIASSKVYELQHRCQTTKTVNGFGASSGFGVTEIYASVYLVKE